MKLKNNLDEMQEQKLKEIEHTGFWLFFWGLFLAMMIQFAFVQGDSLRLAAGEAAVFFPVSCWMVAKCLRNGIWDRRLKADPKTNLIVSLIGGLVAGVFSCIPVFRNFGVTPGLLTLVMAFLFAAGLCFVVLSLSASAYKKQVRKLEHEAEAEEN